MDTPRSHILIVEDEPDIALVLQTRLQSVGFATHAEATGASALAYASGHRPDLVILDLKLPDMEGYEVCQRLRRLYEPKPMPVLMFTAMDQPIDRMRGFASGADAYLSKGGDPAQVVQTVALLLTETTLSGDGLSSAPR